MSSGNTKITGINYQKYHKLWVGAANGCITLLLTYIVTNVRQPFYVYLVALENIVLEMNAIYFIE